MHLSEEADKTDRYRGESGREWEYVDDFFY